MAIIRIDVPDDVLAATGQSAEDFVREARFLLALKLFEMGRISSGRAADLAALGHVDFLLRASRMGVPIADLDEEDLAEELAGAWRPGGL